MIENEEMIEEIVEVEETINEPQQSIVENSINTEALEENIATASGESDKVSEVQETTNQVVVKKKSKVLPLIILFTLLILDIAAIAIYIIGIDKVLSFIK